jgi:transaldolase
MSLASLIATGTKVWLDGIEPDEIARNHAWGITGATSNPTIISKIIGHSHFDERISILIDRGLSDEQAAWELNDELVTMAEHKFLPIWEHTRGNDGYVSFELDPLIDVATNLTHSERVSRYIELGRKWSAGHLNRMIKVPASPAGIGALEALTAAGVKINVTLIFSEQQYELARDAIWRGTRSRNSDHYYFKSVYSVFVSRIDVYTRNHVPDLSSTTQGMVGIAHAKRIWRKNQDFWRDKNLRLQQEIVFASTGVKNAYDSPDKYVQAFAGGDIITSPPATNEAVYESPKVYNRRIDDMPSPSVLEEVDRRINTVEMESRLLAEGTNKFAESQLSLLKLIAQKRASLVADAGKETELQSNLGKPY